MKIGLESQDFSMKNGSRLSQGFESHTFQVNFDLLKLFKPLISDKGIYIHLKLHPEHKKSKKVDLFSEGLPVTVPWVLTVCRGSPKPLLLGGKGPIFAKIR